MVGVPGRVESLEAAGAAVEAILDGVMRESFSAEERTRRRRMAALAKVTARFDHAQLRSKTAPGEPCARERGLQETGCMSVSVFFAEQQRNTNEFSTNTGC